MATLPAGRIGAILLLVRLEGIICIMMAAPLALILALLGGSLRLRDPGGTLGTQGMLLRSCRWPCC